MQIDTFSLAEPGEPYPLSATFGDNHEASRRAAILAAVRAHGTSANALVIGGDAELVERLAVATSGQIWWRPADGATDGSRERPSAIGRHKGRVIVVDPDAKDFFPPEPVVVLLCTALRPATSGDRLTAWAQAFFARHASRSNIALPRMVPARSIWSVQPVQHEFCFTPQRTPIPHFQAPALRDEWTRSLARLRCFATITHNEPLCARLEFDGQLTMQRTGQLNGLRFVTQHVLAEATEESSAVVWPDRLLVIPVARALAVSSGDVIRVRFGFTDSGELQSLLRSSTVTVERRHAAIRTAA